MTASRIGSRIGKAFLIVVLGWYIWKTIVANWHQVSAYNWDFDPLFMVLAVLVFAVSYVFLAWVWGKVLAYVEQPVRFRDAWDIYFVGNLGRYIPGKVWAITGTAIMAGRCGVCPVTAGTASVFAQAYSVISSFVFFGFFIIFRRIDFTGIGYEWFSLLLVVFTVVFMIPSNMERAVNVMLRLLGRETVSLGLTVGKAARIVGWYFLSWIMFGIGFWLFVIAVTGDHSINPFFLSGAYAVAYVLGFLAFFVPGGLGVREGLLSVLLATAMPMGVALLIAFLLRLLVTAIELACVSALFFRKGPVNGKETKTD